MMMKMRWRRLHQVSGVERLGTMVRMMVTINDVRSQVVTNVTIQHGAGSAAWTGLLHPDNEIEINSNHSKLIFISHKPVWNIEQVRIVIRIR